MPWQTFGNALATLALTEMRCTHSEMPKARIGVLVVSPPRPHCFFLGAWGNCCFPQWEPRARNQVLWTNLVSGRRNNGEK